MLRSFILLLSISALYSCFGQTKHLAKNDIADTKNDSLEIKTKWIFLRDKQSIDGYTRIGDSIFGGEIACNVKPLSGVDVETFKVLPGSKYAKDKNHVYFPLVINCVDYDECGVCYFAETIIQLANPLTFKILGKDYSTDGTFAYFRGRQIYGANGATFDIIEGPDNFYFAKDNENVFRYGEIFKGADPQTFYFDKNDIRDESNGVKKYIIGDKNGKWEYSPPDSVKRIDNN